MRVVVDHTSLRSTPVTSELVHGAVELTAGERGLRPWRLPGRARRQIHDEGMAAVVAAPSGVRLRMRTAADRLLLQVVPLDRTVHDDPLRPSQVYDVLVDGELLAQPVAEPAADPGVPAADGDCLVDVAAACPGGRLPGGERLVEIWLPAEEPTELIAVHGDAPVAPAAQTGPRWVHHGSSISHGAVAVGAAHAWPAVAARSAGLDLVNLGFAGQAMMDQYTARTIRDLEADLLSVKLGINIVNGDTFRLRSFAPAVHGFLDTIRDGHPETPLLLMTPIWCGIHEHTPGPVEIEEVDDGGGPRSLARATGDPAQVAAGRLTLTIIREELARIAADRAAEDPHLHLVEGPTLYGAEDARTHPLPDALHPDTATHRLIGERAADGPLRAVREARAASQRGDRR
ncbi:SGNH/GDSL hydrolase family protein [Nesterenkonia halophila]|uniref:SGNH/GDSL hydrolase family protein n=1 Tax=Nesterenkonia halophila TaxID=302044 RepID=UPI00129213AB|nr:SGNH/GDSL hydrolase family protein [Nesterenkonia halophila]